jgi:hypothetical protein
LADGINQPTQDCLDGVPGGVAVAQLLQREGFFCLGVFGRGLEKVVDSVQEDASNGGEAVLGALTQGYEVIHKYVEV